MSNTKLKSIEFEPGINRDETDYAAEGSYIDCDKIRFRSGRAEKIGGWARQPLEQDNDSNVNTFTGVARDMLSWNDLQFNRYTAVATNEKVEVRFGGKIFDITPVRADRNLTDAITTTQGESEVKITDTSAHALEVNDFVFVNNQQTAVDGITLDGEYRVTEVVNSTEFKVDSGTDATGSTSNAGGSLDIDYLLSIGPVSNGGLTGWSGGTWNTPGQGGGGWNRPRDGTGGLQLRQWSMDNWGEDLVACPRGGKLYNWDIDDGLGGRLKEIANAPDENLFVLVAQPSRQLVALGSEVEATGTFDPLIIRWSDIEDRTTWQTQDTNSAGEFRLSGGNTIVGGIRTRSEILIFTDTDVYAMRFVGGTQVFEFEPLGTNISAASQHAAVDVNGLVFWMGDEDFYVYDGVAKSLPNRLNRFIFDQDGEGRFNENQKEKIYAGINKEFHEVWWFYPGVNSEENNRYVVYNYQENVWYIGSLNRTVWNDRGTFDRPLALDPNGTLFAHETGKDADGKSMRAFIQSAYFDIGDGEQFAFVDRIIPDLELIPNRNSLITMFFRKFPNRSAVQKGPFTFNGSKDDIRLRGRGREMSIRYEVDAIGADFELGNTRIGMQPDGER